MEIALTHCNFNLIYALRARFNLPRDRPDSTVVKTVTFASEVCNFMGVPARLAANVDSEPVSPASRRIDKTKVLQELEVVLNSPAFRQSNRSRQFLSFVVRHKLEGREDVLKERTIGAELFDRKADYSTGDDPIVRVQAGDVRKRLEHYYKEFGSESRFSIELPVGSYVPEFHFRTEGPAPVAAPEAAPKRRKYLLWLLPMVCAVLIAVPLVIRFTHPNPKPTVLDEFWAPVVSTSRPVLICLPKLVLYLPSYDLFRRYSKTHQGAFQTAIERFGQKLPLDPKEKIEWGDMKAYPDLGLVSGDVYAGFRISGLLNRINKENQLRIGNASSFEDLRSSPAVIVGAFSNRWTLEMTSSLRFVFAEHDDVFWIEDRNSPDKRWLSQVGPGGQIVEDYGLVTRLLDSKTGQLVITVAGITAPGTDAAAQLISDPSYLATALKSAPADWRKKNIQFVVKTEVVDAIAGPPQVVASYFW